LKIDHHGEGDSEELISNISSDGDNPEATLLREAQSKTVRLVLDALPRLLREVLVFRELEELSHRQISDITDLPIGTVMSRLARARERHLEMPGAAKQMMVPELTSQFSADTEDRLFKLDRFLPGSGNRRQAARITSSHAILRRLHHCDFRLEAFGSHDRRLLRQHPLHDPVAKYERVRHRGGHVGADHQEQ
jgi:hypothetical protein